MRPALFQCLLILCVALPARATDLIGQLRGRVVDAETGEYLVGALIKVAGTDRITVSDEYGTFYFVELPVGTYHLTADYIGYTPTAGTAVEVRPNTLTAARLQLRRGELTLPAVQVGSAPTHHQRSLQRLDLLTRPINNGQELLRLVPGLVIAQHAGGGKAEQLFLRGFDIDHGTDIALSVDGLPVNMVSHAHGQGYADLHFIIPETVERIDFEKGSYATAVGNFSTAGYADFRTRSQLTQNSLKLEAGRFDTYRAVGQFKLLDRATTDTRQDAYLATEYQRSAGYFDSPQDFDRLNLFGKYRLLLNDRQSLELSASTFSSSWDASGQVPDRAVQDGTINRFGAIDDTEGGTTSRTNLNLRHVLQLRDGGSIRQQAYFTYYDFLLWSNFTFFLEDPVNGDQIRQRESRRMLGYNADWQRTDRIGGRDWRHRIGVQVRHDDTNDSELSRTRNRAELLERLAFGDVTETRAGVFVDETVILSPKLEINAGMRYDAIRSGYADHLDEADPTPRFVTDGTFSPKLKLHYQATARLGLFARSGVSFHSNDSRVVVARDGLQTLPKAYGLETGVQARVGEQLLLTATVWQLDLEQEFIYVGDAAVVEPSGRTRRRGIDLAGRWQPCKQLFVDGDVSLVKPRSRDDAEGENYIPLAPTLAGTAGISYRNATGFTASLRSRFVGDRAANEDYSIAAEGQFLLDGVLRYQTDRWAIHLNGENLLNAEWNEAQFETTSRLRDEPAAITELHYTPGTPINVRTGFTLFF